MRSFSQTLLERINLVHILAVGTAIRVIGLLSKSTIEIDGTSYAMTGESFARGDFSQALRAPFPPLFPLLVGVFRVFVPDVELAGRMVSLVFGILLICLVFVWLKKFIDEKHAMVGAFFAAIHPYLVRSSTTVLSESVAAFVFAATVFLFYEGWVTGRWKDLAFSGLLLSLTYLARPEYAVYCAPLALFLLIRKRYTGTAVFLVCFLILTLAYVGYMKTETGLLVVSKKAIMAKTMRGNAYHSYLLPVLPFAVVVRNIPLVALHLFEAIFVPFVILAVMGFRRVGGAYRLLVAGLVVVHVVSLASITASTIRFSVEFIALVIPFAVQGVDVLRGFCHRNRGTRVLYAIIVAGIVAACLLQGYDPPDKGRALHKQAGLSLLSHDPGKRIASRLPLVAFYSQGTWIPIPEMENCTEVAEFAEKHGAEYVVLDDGMGWSRSQPAACLSQAEPAGEFRDGKSFVKVYRGKGG